MFFCGRGSWGCLFCCCFVLTGSAAFGQHTAHGRLPRHALPAWGCAQGRVHRRGWHSPQRGGRMTLGCKRGVLGSPLLNSAAAAGASSAAAFALTARDLAAGHRGTMTCGLYDALLTWLSLFSPSTPLLPALLPLPPPLPPLPLPPLSPAHKGQLCACSWGRGFLCHPSQHTASANPWVQCP